MCGIAGLYSKEKADKYFLYKKVEKMIKNLSHRGPDSFGIKNIGENICIGNSRLSFVDLEGGDQPIESDGIYIVFNGEIYNYQDLRNEFLLDCNFKTKTDTEVILHGYKKFGLKFFSKLNGMFAICIIDGNKLILVRDRLGIKPLYYRVDKNEFSFASEMKILYKDSDCFSIPDSYMFFETTVGNYSLNKSIKELQPASILIYNNEKITEHKYWDIYEKINETSCKTEKQFIDELRYLIIDSVMIRKPAMKFGVSISGGLDSAIVASISKPDFLFTSVSKNQYLDEEKFADDLCGFLNIPLIKTYPNKEDFLQTLPELIKALDYPTTTIAAYPMYQLFKEIKKHVKVVLNGQGADELFGGYIRYILLYIDYLKKFSPEFNNYNPLQTHYWGSNFSDSLKNRYLKLLSRSKTKPPISNELNFILNKLEEKPVTSAGVIDLLTTFPPLLRTDDRISMAFSVESRSPFLDYRILELSMLVPDKFKIKISNSGKSTVTFNSKYILKKAVGDFLPKSILNRFDKVGYISPVSFWLKNDFSNLINNLQNMNEPMFSKILSIKNNPRGLYDRYEWQLLQFYIWKMVFFDKITKSNILKELNKLL